MNVKRHVPRAIRHLALQLTEALSAARELNGAVGGLELQAAKERTEPTVLAKGLHDAAFDNGPQSIFKVRGIVAWVAFGYVRYGQKRGRHVEKRSKRKV